MREAWDESEHDAAYDQCVARLRKDMFGHYKSLTIDEPVVDSTPSTETPAKTGRSKVHDRTALLEQIQKMRRDRVNRKQIAATLNISLSFLGKLLTDAGIKGDMGQECESCGKPTGRRADAKLCHQCEGKKPKEA